MSPYRDITTGCLAIKHVAARLLDLAAAFGETGNKLVEQRLCDLAGTLEDAERSIRHGTTAWLDQDVSRAESASLAVLKAAIAGVMIAKPD